MPTKPNRLEIRQHLSAFCSEIIAESGKKPPQVAKAIGVHHDTIYALIDPGKDSEISAVTLILFLEYFNIDLLGLLHSRKPPSPGLREFFDLEFYNSKLSSKERVALVALDQLGCFIFGGGLSNITDIDEKMRIINRWAAPEKQRKTKSKADQT